jgi:dTDP-4-dehydrorhamnose reductase
MRVAVTGAGGGLGRAFRERGAAGHEVVGFTHADLPVEQGKLVEEHLAAAQPDVILHLAAMTSVDRCEEDPDAAFAVNVQGAENVARAAERCGAVLVLLSTDYVFDGEKDEPFDEWDQPNPLSEYGA